MNVNSSAHFVSSFNRLQIDNTGVSVVSCKESETQSSACVTEFIVYKSLMRMQEARTGCRSIKAKVGASSLTGSGKKIDIISGDWFGTEDVYEVWL